MLFLNLIFVSCSTPPKRAEPLEKITQGQWSTTVLIRDLKKDISRNLSVDFRAERSKRLRMDITSAFGPYIGSVVLINGSFKALLAKQKAFYHGRAKAKSLKKVLNVKLDPKLLQNMIFDMPIENKMWTCEFDELKVVSQCSQNTKEIKILWQKREGFKKTVLVTTPEFEINMIFKEFKPDVEFSDKTFALKPLKNFKVYKIR